ncbi:19410_t:CDS:1, partial [Dentiscutata erythropus]
AVSINPKRRDFEGQQESLCSTDFNCDSHICRNADQDANKCQTTDTRENGAFLSCQCCMQESLLFF